MANYKVSDTDLTAVANAIRAKSGGSSQLAFPAGFVSEIQAIPSGGGIQMAEGTFTIASESTDNAPTITHNLGTKKVAVLIYPKTKITANGGYRNFYAQVINVNEIEGGETWTFDWTSYNSHFSGDETVTFPSDKLRIGTVHVSPWATQSNWYAGGNPSTIENGLNNNTPRVVFTDNTVRVRGAGGNLTWCAGTYYWKVWKLG